MLKILVTTFFLLLFSRAVFSHAGSHGNNECIVSVGDVELRLNGYQFQGKHPDRHYCRHYPNLGQTIIKIDSVSADLSSMAIELKLLKRHSWLKLVTNRKEAFSVIKKLPIQYFAEKVVSIEENIQGLDIYAIDLRLHKKNGEVTEKQFLFIAGIPFIQLLVLFAILLLLFIIFIFFKNRIRH